MCGQSRSNAEQLAHIPGTRLPVPPNHIAAGFLPRRAIPAPAEEFQPPLRHVSFSLLLVRVNCEWGCPLEPPCYIRVYLGGRPLPTEIQLVFHLHVPSQGRRSIPDFEIERATKRQDSELNYRHFGYSLATMQAPPDTENVRSFTFRTDSLYCRGRWTLADSLRFQSSLSMRTTRPRLET